MSKQPAKLPAPAYAVATGIRGRVVFTNATPELLHALHQLARQHGVRQMNLSLTAPDLGEE